MKPHSPYDVIVSPVITEKSTLVSEANQVINNFNALDQQNQQDLINFLRSL